MTDSLGLATLVAIVSVALNKPTLSSLAILGDISLTGTIKNPTELANLLQVCLDSGAKRILMPTSSASDLPTVPSELIGAFNINFYSSAEDAVFKALGVE
jgi:ATP-dependent Lon protease